MRFTVMGLLLVTAPELRAGAIRGRSRGQLANDFARALAVPVSRVVKVQGYDLRCARGVDGFSLGIYRTRDGSFTLAGAVVYAQCGSRYCLRRVFLNRAERAQPVRVVDLFGVRTTVVPSGVSWFTRSVAQPSGKIRWPVLLLQTQYEYDKELHRHLTAVSLRNPSNVSVMVRIKTLSRPARSAKIGPISRCGHTVGRRVSALTFAGNGGRSPELTVTETAIQHPRSRCRPRRPHQILKYRFKEGRFVRWR